MSVMRGVAGLTIRPGAFRGVTRKLTWSAAAFTCLCSPLWQRPVRAQTGPVSATQIQETRARNFDYTTFNGASPVTDFAWFQRPFDVLQNVPIQNLGYSMASDATSSSAFTPWSTTAWQTAFSGRTDQEWLINYPNFQFTIPVGTWTHGGQIVVGQEWNGNGTASFTLTVESGSPGGSWTQRGQATFGSSNGLSNYWSQLSIDNPLSDTLLRFTFTGVGNLPMYMTNVKYLTLRQVYNTNNNLPFFTDFASDVAIGTPTFGVSKLSVQGGTGDSSTAALNVTNASANPLLYVRDDGSVGVGTTSPQHTLSVIGSIGATEVVVTNAGSADYVFDRDYRLEPLSDVADYIAANHHLPDIPSAAEVKEKGVSLGDMQAKLLAKVEELTLRMIEAEKANEDLRRKVADLERKGQNK